VVFLLSNARCARIRSVGLWLRCGWSPKELWARQSDQRSVNTFAGDHHRANVSKVLKVVAKLFQVDFLAADFLFLGSCIAVRVGSRTYWLEEFGMKVITEFWASDFKCHLGTVDSADSFCHTRNTFAYLHTINKADFSSSQIKSCLDAKNNLCTWSAVTIGANFQPYIFASNLNKIFVQF